MATYDLNNSHLSHYLKTHVSPTVGAQVVAALKAADAYPTNDKLFTRVDELNGSATVNEAGEVSLVVEAGAGTLNVSSSSSVIVATGSKNVAVNIQDGAGDKVFLGSGRDTLHGGSGHDTLYAGGQSVVYAGTGDSTLYGGIASSAHDTLYGSNGGDDYLAVRQGNNVLRAGHGLDTLRGGSGHDTLYGAGNTLLQAGSGGSTLFGGAGASAHDTLYGGAKNDTFNLTQTAQTAHGAKFTVDGKAGNDTLQLSGRFEDATVHTAKDGTTTIKFSDNGKVVETVYAKNVETIKFSDHTIHLDAHK